MSGLTTSLCGSFSKSIMNKIPLSFLYFIWFWLCQQKVMTKTVTWFATLSCLSGSLHFTDVHTGIHMGTQEIQMRGKTIIFKTTFPLVTLKKLTRTPNCLCHTVIDPAPPQVHDGVTDHLPNPYHSDPANHISSHSPSIFCYLSAWPPNA